MLKFYKPKNVSKTPLDVKAFKYYKYHEGLDGNTAYYVKARFLGRLLTIELINIPDGRWCFHIEEDNEMVIDSRLGNCYYPNAEDCHSAMVNALSDKYNP